MRKKKIIEAKQKKNTRSNFVESVELELNIVGEVRLVRELLLGVSLLDVPVFFGREKKKNQKKKKKCSVFSQKKKKETTTTTIKKKEKKKKECHILDGKIESFLDGHDFD